jgi:chemotaxis protein CheD
VTREPAPTTPSLQRRSVDPAAGRLVVKIGPGELHVSTNPDEAIATVLGSCVAACVCDQTAGVGGMNHFMLPTSDTGTWGKGDGSLRYGNFAMAQLIEAILQRGGRRERLAVKLFGGAHLGQDPGVVGARNAEFAIDFLARQGLHPLVRELGGICARRILYLPLSGRAFMAELREPPGGVLA